MGHLREAIDGSNQSGNRGPHGPYRADEPERGEGQGRHLGLRKGATTEGPDFIPLAERIATFDNDGTPWVE
jgi:hypothetical protein